MKRKSELVSGKAIAEFEYHGNGTQRRTKFNIASVADLDNLIRQAQAACFAKCGMGNPNRRFALTAGQRPEGIGPGLRWDARLGYYR